MLDELLNGYSSFSAFYQQVVRRHLPLSVSEVLLISYQDLISSSKVSQTAELTITAVRNRVVGKDGCRVPRFMVPCKPLCTSTRHVDLLPLHMH